MQEGSGVSSSGESAVGEVQQRAQEQIQNLAGQAQQAAGNAQSQIKEQLDSRSTQAGNQVRSTAEDLRVVGKELRNQGKETPARVAEQAAQRIDQVGRYLAESSPDQVLSDIEGYARRQPWVVVGGGVALGFIASRFLKASGSRRYNTMYGWRLPATQAGGATGEIPSTTSPVTQTPPAPAAPAAPQAPSPQMGVPPATPHGGFSEPANPTGSGRV